LPACCRALSVCVMQRYPCCVPHAFCFLASRAKCCLSESASFCCSLFWGFRAASHASSCPSHFACMCLLDSAASVERCLCCHVLSCMAASRASSCTSRFARLCLLDSAAPVERRLCCHALSCRAASHASSRTGPQAAQTTLGRQSTAQRASWLRQRLGRSWLNGAWWKSAWPRGVLLTR
jgi:hypothetical protein